MLDATKSTNRQPLTDTLVDLIRAMDHQQAVVIAYSDADEAPSVRTIEIHDLYTTGDDGAIIALSMDRLSGRPHTFRPERIQAYIALDDPYELEFPAPLDVSVHFTARTEEEFVALELDRD
ncbi:WYL domain-containing protein [Streptomyces sp. NPDC057199]|uniref:WYL domain-containing protein n=1 Tax=Streptomyces sp. NPDC057199 TaxID=3346047 RepID=UPI0036340093